MNILNKILRVFAGKNRAQETVEADAASKQPALSQWHTYGNHLYRRADEVFSVIFTNASKGIVRTIVDDEGYICNFPGVEDEALEQLKDVCFDSQICFRTDFQRQPDGKILKYWQIQPDGRYWMDDDGYGMTPDNEIYLYAKIDEEDNFVGPFSLNRG